MCFAPQWHALFRDLNLQKWSEPLMFLTCWLGNVLRATTACTFSTSEPPKVVRTPSVFNILIWKCASRHNGVHLFDISTSKSGPKVVCFVHFDIEMCFAPQWRALFRDPNLQKWSEPLVFFLTCWLINVLRATTASTFSTSEPPKVVRTPCVLTFWLRNVLRATTACTCSTSQLPKVVRPRCDLYILTSKCASRHSGVHFFNISTSKSGPTMVCFVHFDWKCASRHNGVHFFDIATSKSAPTMVCFVHFDLEMCFAPQRRAILHLSSGQLAPHPPL